MDYPFTFYLAEAYVRVLYLVLDLGVQLASIGMEFADMEL